MDQHVTIHTCRAGPVIKTKNTNVEFQKWAWAEQVRRLN